MSRISRTPIATAAALTAAALTLSACSQDLAEPDLDAATTSAEDSQVQAEDAPEAVTETVTETEQP